MRGNLFSEFPLNIENQSLSREEIVNFVRKWGDLNTDGILDSSCQIYFDPSIEGLIGYRLEAKTAVVFGDPVCAAEDKPQLAHSFQKYCSEKNIKVVYTIASEEFAHWAAANLFSVLIEFGESYVLNPLNNPADQKGPNAVLVRKKVKHAQKEGVIVHEYLEKDFQIEHSIEKLARNWLKGRRGPQIYLAHITLFNDQIGKRWFYAICAEKIVGILVLNELKWRHGWLLNNMMIDKDAPHGISETLIISVLHILEKENCQCVVVGPIPGMQLGTIKGLGRFFTKMTRWAYRFSSKVFHLDRYKAFWGKFQPAVPNSSYLIFPEKNLSFSSIRAILKAFNSTLI